jgi:chromosome segregation ATPase
MNSPAGTIVWILSCAGLIGSLIWSQKHANDRHKADEISIGNYSNKWVETSAGLDQQRQVNTSLEGDLKRQRENFSTLTNAYARISTALDQAAASLKSVQEGIAQRDIKIADLKSQNQALDRRVLDLRSAISNLTSAISSDGAVKVIPSLAGSSTNASATNPPPVK